MSYSRGIPIPNIRTEDSVVSHAICTLCVDLSDIEMYGLIIALNSKYNR